jgi:nucleoside-diphosphate-sugar epimerase
VKDATLECLEKNVPCSSDIGRSWRWGEREFISKHVEGPVGVQSRNFRNARIYSIGWRAKVSLKEGIELTYPWIEAQVKVLANRSLVAVT